MAAAWQVDLRALAAAKVSSLAAPHHHHHHNSQQHSTLNSQGLPTSTHPSTAATSGSTTALASPAPEAQTINGAVAAYSSTALIGSNSASSTDAGGSLGSSLQGLHGSAAGAGLGQSSELSGISQALSVAAVCDAATATLAELAVKVRVPGG